jgi:hypothetical protein
MNKNEMIDAIQAKEETDNIFSYLVNNIIDGSKVDSLEDLKTNQLKWLCDKGDIKLTEESYVSKKEMIDAIDRADDGGAFSDILDEALNDSDVEYISQLGEQELENLLDSIPGKLTEEADEDFDIELEDDEFDGELEDDLEDEDFEEEDDIEVTISNLFDGFKYAAKTSSFTPEFVGEDNITSQSITEWATDVIASETDLVDAAKLFGLPLETTKDYMSDIIKHSEEMAAHILENIEDIKVVEDKEPVEDEDLELEDEAGEDEADDGFGEDEVEDEGDDAFGEDEEF